MKEIDHTPYVNLKEKNKRVGTQGEDNDLEDEEKMMDPEEKQSQKEIRSVADASIDERSFEN